MSCISLQISNYKYVHLYQTNYECFGSYWIISLLIFMIIIFIYIYIFYKIYKQNDEKTRYNKNSTFRNMLSSFKSQYYYFEFVLFSRRLIIACMTRIAVFTSQSTTIILITILQIYLINQCYTLPFRHNDLNIIEILCLLSLIIILISSNELNNTQNNKKFLNSFITFCILIPLIIFIYYVIFFIALSFYIKNKTTPTQYLQQLVDKTQKRLPIHLQYQLKLHKKKNDRDIDFKDDDDYKCLSDNNTKHVNIGVNHINLNTLKTMNNDESSSSSSSSLECVSNKQFDTYKVEYEKNNKNNNNNSDLIINSIEMMTYKQTVTQNEGTYNYEGIDNQYDESDDSEVP